MTRPRPAANGRDKDAAGDPGQLLKTGDPGMADDQHYDVVIIGTGAGGGTLGHRLATSGVKVLWLERGDVPATGARQLGDPGGVRPRQVPRPGGLVRRARPRVPARGQLLRRGEHQVLRRGPVPPATGGLRRVRHHGGISPAWPIAYDDLEPYYTQAEHLYLVHGEHGEDPTEGPASAQYPFRRCPTNPASSS